MKDENSDNRKITLRFRVSEDEEKKIEEKYENSGFKSKSQFIRRMLLDGMILYINEDTLGDFRYKLSSIANNTNQIAKRVNGTGHIYDEDIREIREGVDEIRQLLKSFLLPLQNPRHLPISQVLKKQETDS